MILASATRNLVWNGSTFTVDADGPWQIRGLPYTTWADVSSLNGTELVFAVLKAGLVACPGVAVDQFLADPSGPLVVPLFNAIWDLASGN